MNTITEDVIVEITSHLDALSTWNLLRTSKRFWNISKKQIVMDRIVPYQKYMKYKQWNKGLVEATKRNNFPQIIFFIEKGADDFSKACYEAAKIGSTELMDYFSKSVKHILWTCALQFACEHGHQLINYFLSKPGMDPLDLCEGIYGAAKGRHMELIRQLISVQAPNIFVFREALIHAARGGQKDIIDWCIENGANTWTAALEQSIEGGHVELADFFFRKLNRQRGHNLLRRAASSQNMKMIEFVIKKGFSKNWNEGIEGAAEVGNQAMVEFFYERGANVDVALWSAAQNGHLSIVQYLYSKGVTQDHLNRALEQASQTDEREVILYLIEKGANTWDEALKNAASFGHASLVELFIQKGATCLSGALGRACGHFETMKILVENGATIAEEILCTVRAEKFLAVMKEGKQIWYREIQEEEFTNIIDDDLYQ